MSVIREQFKHDLPWIGAGATVIAMLIDEVEALKLAQQHITILKAELETLHNCNAAQSEEISRLRSVTQGKDRRTIDEQAAEIVRLRERVRVLGEAVEMQIGSYPRGTIDKVYLAIGMTPAGPFLSDTSVRTRYEAFRAALAKTEPRPEPTPCVYCGPTCYGGAAHNQRVENGEKSIEFMKEWAKR